MDFMNNVAVITGTSSGIGYSCCKKLIDLNCKVYGLDINESNLENDLYEHFTIDITDEKSVIEAINTIGVKTSHKMNYLVNTAGIFASGKPFYELDSMLWNKVMSVNVTGTFLVSKYVSKEMIKNKSGKIVNISCIRSSIFKPNMAEYVASKGAIVSLTSAMALDLAPYNIQVNSVAPGFTYTGMTAKEFDKPEVREFAESIIPSGHIALPEDISSVVMFLLSDMSNYITGTTIFADGGYRLQK